MTFAKNKYAERAKRSKPEIDLEFKLKDIATKTEVPAIRRAAQMPSTRGNEDVSSGDRLSETAVRRATVSYRFQSSSKLVALGDGDGSEYMAYGSATPTARAIAAQDVLSRRGHAITSREGRAPSYRGF